MKSNLYPLKFVPIFKEKIWGGKKMGQLLGKRVDPEKNIGESWELSGVREEVSMVEYGLLKGSSLTELIKEYKEKLLGEHVYKSFGDEFPLLVKFIDANDDLSIQVHPNDALARERHDSFGKTEMWYVMDADPGASLIAGFNQNLSKAAYLKHCKDGTLGKVLNKEKVEKGDAFYIPAGRVHTIGKGLMVAEIQQTSDITYRIHDFNRIDTRGNARELHIEESIDALDYSVHSQYKTDYSNDQNANVNLVKSPYFTTNKLKLTQSFSLDYSRLDSFVIFTCVKGKAVLIAGEHEVALNMGEVILLPADCTTAKLIPFEQAELLETYIASN